MSSLFRTIEEFLVGRDTKQLREKLGAVNRELREIGQRLVLLGTELTSSPENVCFEGQPAPADFFVSHEFAFAAQDLDLKRITSLIAEKRDICRKLTALNRESEELDSSPVDVHSEPSPRHSGLGSFLSAVTSVPIGRTSSPSKSGEPQ